jgi:FMN phosphatase YigB (HAD superfamily)
MSSSSRPQVLLFDIGGVCVSPYNARRSNTVSTKSIQVVSPFQAILDYEISRGIPPGWINQSISASGHSGAWQKLERGDIPLDAAFFRQFKADLSNEQRWRTYYAKYLASARKEKVSDAAEETAYQAPGVPDIDAEWLYWEMMRISRSPDPHMYPALKKLRAAADKSDGKLILAALSNTSIFPPDHPFSDETTPEFKQNKELKGLFDVFISSAHVGMRKPDEDIYRYTITRLHEYVKTKFGTGVKAEDITFLDDIGANLRTAKRLGLGTIKVTLGRADLAVEELEKVTGLSLKEGSRAKL